MIHLAQSTAGPYWVESPSFVAAVVMVFVPYFHHTVVEARLPPSHPACTQSQARDLRRGVRRILAVTLPSAAASVLVR